VVLWLADPHAPPEPMMLRALAESVGAGLVVGGAALAVRALGARGAAVR
jgi:hypothetical protein